MSSIEPTLSHSSEHASATAVGPSTILIADDEHLVASGLATNLAALGYTVVGPAGDGAEAIELCRRDRPDLALLDIRMPRLGGLEAAEAIYREQGIPVIIVSAYSDAEYVERAARFGVFGYLLKPVTQDQLRLAIEIAWSRYGESCDQSAEIRELKERLENRKIIERAKWVLVDRKQIDEPEAMRTLQRHARNNRKTLVDVARSILDNAELL